jgi:hypothetical protein
MTDAWKREFQPVMPKEWRTRLWVRPGRKASETGQRVSEPGQYAERAERGSADG